MRLLFIAPRFHTNQLGLVQKLTEEGHAVDFFVIGKGISESYDNLEPKQIPISKLTTWYVNKFAKNIDFARYAKIAIPSFRKFNKMVNGFKPDVVILREASSPVYSWFAIIMALFSSTQIVFYTQGPKYVKHMGLARRLHDWFFVKLLSVKWYTPVLYKGSLEQSPKEIEYIEFIPFFVYPQIEIYKKKPVEKNINFLCVAKFERRKNLKLLLETALELRRQFQNFNLIIIGSTGSDDREKYFQEVLTFVKTNRMTGFITVLKNVPFANMKDHYLQSDIMILPSIKEPASVAQLEAMSYGLGVICSKDNGTAHYIKNGRNGFIVNANSSELYNAMAGYIKNPELAVCQGKESLAILSNELSVENNYKKFISLIQVTTFR